MLTEVTVNVPPRAPLPPPDMPEAPDAPAAPEAPDAPDPLAPPEPVDELDDGDEVDDEDELEPPPADMRPVTETWWPTCSLRFTPASAISRSSLAPPIDPLIERPPAWLAD